MGADARIAEILETIYPASAEPADYTTTAAYVDIAKIDTFGKTKVVFTIANTVNSIKWKILASIDDVTYVELEAEASVAASAQSSWVASEVEASYRYFKAQVKDDAGHGVVQVRAYSKI